MADEEQCAPGVCESSDLILSFVNTRPLTDKHPDLLGDQAGLTEWLTTARLADPAVVATNADAVAARELRDAFVTMLRSHVGCEDGPAAEAEAYLWRTAERYPLTPGSTPTAALSCHPSPGCRARSARSSRRWPISPPGGPGPG